MSANHIHPVGYLIALGIAFVAGFVAWGFVTLLTNHLFALVVGVPVGCAAFGIALAIISKSPDYGEKCRFCPARGKITDKQLEKNFSGTVEREGVKYNQYTVTYLRTCQMCGKEWPSVTQEEDSNFLGEINKTLEGFKGF